MSGSDGGGEDGFQLRAFDHHDDDGFAVGFAAKKFHSVFRELLEFFFSHKYSTSFNDENLKTVSDRRVELKTYFVFYTTRTPHVGFRSHVIRFVIVVKMITPSDWSNWETPIFFFVG